MSEARARTRSVLVVGDGIVGVAAAIALRRALPEATVTLVRLPSDPGGWIDRIGAASPAIHGFHRAIGLDARLFARRAGADPVHLRRHIRADGGETREASTAAIPFVEGVPLHQIWLRHRAETGDAPDFAAMLLALRDARGEDGGFGVRFDSAAYAALLDEMAAALTVTRHDSADIAIETDGGAIRGITTTAGERLSADLYVDAAGPRSRLLTALGVEWHDHSDLVPAMTLSVTPGSDIRAGEESLAGHPGGQDWRTHLWQATIRRGDDIAPGRFAHGWHGNAVAIGEAAVRAPATDGILLGLAMEDILRVVALLPRPGGSGSDIAEYNRRAAIAHDALAAWSSLNLVADGAARPDRLARTLAAFDARGQVAIDELDPIAPGQWLARLMTLRPPPRRIDPTALALPGDVIRTTVARAAPR